MKRGDIFTIMRIIPVSHCLLNAHSKVKSSYNYSHVSREIIVPLLQHGYGIFQLPCPELTYGGLQRFGQSRSQYDNPFYRQHCSKLLDHVVAQFEEYLLNSINLGPILGIEGSPSCAVSNCFDGNWGGELSDQVISSFHSPLQACSRAGVFIEQLQKRLKDRNLNIAFLGIDEENLAESRRRILDYLNSSESQNGDIPEVMPGTNKLTCITIKTS